MRPRKSEQKSFKNQVRVDWRQKLQANSMLCISNDIMYRSVKITSYLNLYFHAQSDENNSNLVQNYSLFYKQVQYSYIFLFSEKYIKLIVSDIVKPLLNSLW